MFWKIAKTNKYFGTVESLGKHVKSTGREWADSILFAVLAATLIRWSTFEAFTIPTSSMESTLMVGDYLFVSKLHYGPRAPITPLQVPLTHQSIWFTDKTGDGTGGTRSYLDLIQLPYFRFPGITEIKRNDIVVFNWPWDNGKDIFPEFETLQRSSLRPTDLKTNYVKRCVAVAGDTLEIINQDIYINGKVSHIDGRIQHLHEVFVNKNFYKKQFGEINLMTLNNFAVKICDDNKVRVESRRDQSGLLFIFGQYDC
jgi:signal peptidase I